MSSFFSGIQQWFKGGFNGRYLGLILMEIGNRQPQPLIQFVCNACKLSSKEFKKARFEAEYRFKGKRGPRIADLAIFRDDELEPTVLIEIKYFDKPLAETETKPGQLEDYIFWKKNGEDSSRSVLLLSRDLYFDNGYVTRRWSELARHLRPYGEKSDLIAMLVEYLEEEGIVMQNIKSKELLGFFKRLLCGRKNSGVLANNLAGPAEFSNLLNNVKLLSVAFDLQFKTAWLKAGIKAEGDEYSKTSRIATIDFRLSNRTTTTDESKMFDGTDSWLNDEVKDGGLVSVFARYSLGHGYNRWLRIEYGFDFDIDSGNSVNDPPTVDIYARAYGGVLNVLPAQPYISKKVKFDYVTSDAEKHSERIEKKVNLLLVDVINQILTSGAKLDQQQKKALVLLEKSLSPSCAEEK